MTPAPLLLLVDDDPAVLASLQFSLELEGFRVGVFDSGETLMEQADLAHPSCLVLDYRLPGVDGLALLQVLRERGETCPAVIITSNPTRSVRQRASEAGAVLIEKPLLNDGLTVAIRTLIKADGQSAVDVSRRRRRDRQTYYRRQQLYSENGLD